MDPGHGRRAAAARLIASEERIVVGDTFPRPEHGPGARLFLRFDGLECGTEVALNGEVILEARNFFRSWRVEVTGRLLDSNTLAFRVAPLESLPAPRKPRARWRPVLARPGELRWHRTPLLGHMPGWNPPRARSGAWRPVVLEVVQAVHVPELQVAARLGGEVGEIRVRGRFEATGATTLRGARLCLEGRAFHLPLVAGAVDARVPFPDPPRWWPHTHGQPRLVPWRLEVLAGERWVEVREGRVGFREIAVDTGGGDFALRVNGVAVFCRGSCWAPVDFAAVHASPEATRAALVQLRDAGANLVRIPGITAYESPAFHEACDELGLLVWQDFMFANFDYPFGDPGFRAECEAECREHASRLARHPSTAVLCGGSEVAQQAAMLGLDSRHWLDPFFSDTLPAILAEVGADVPYVPSTPWGGALPFHVGTGVAHYYGVGAYRRPLADAKSARVRFAAECLAFSQLGSELGSELGSDPNSDPSSDPVPRDPGAGWDFADVRDHYLEMLFGEAPVALRSQDLERYRALSEVVPGEVMRRTYAEWRSDRSECRGALTWMWRDVQPGAGWGVIDHRGRPKAGYWYLKRAWQPCTVHLTDEGLDGYAVHVVNDRAEPFQGRVRLVLLRHGQPVTASRAQDVALPPRSRASLAADALLGHFTDATNAYRFGPAKYDVVAAVLERDAGERLAEDVHFPLGWNLPSVPARLALAAEPSAPGSAEVVLSIASDHFLQAVRIEAQGWEPEDNHFHLLPGVERRIVLRPLEAAAPPTWRVTALNLRGPAASVSLEPRDAGQAPGTRTTTYAAGSGRRNQTVAISPPRTS